jgi:hypothetical protein
MRDKILHFLSRKLNEKELDQLLKDLELNDSKTTINLIKKRKQQLKRENQAICASCNNTISGDSHKYTFIFGPKGLQKRATFCRVDCLRSFLDLLDGMDYDNKDEFKIERITNY